METIETIFENYKNSYNEETPCTEEQQTEFNDFSNIGENVPVTVAARVMKKDPQFIRQGIIQGFLKFGVAFKKEGSSQYDYYISPMKFWVETGYIYQGEE